MKPPYGGTHSALMYGGHRYLSASRQKMCQKYGIGNERDIRPLSSEKCFRRDATLK